MASDIRWDVVSNQMTGAIQGQIRGLSYDAVKDTMDDILTDTLRRMHIPGSGRIYVHNGVSHQASAPGQAPAAETGALIASYEVGVAMESSGPVGIIHSDSPYAATLEYGNARISPRPALTPAGEAVSGKFEGRLEAKLRAIGV